MRTAGRPTGGPFPDQGVIYRRSHKSVTMRCQACGLQWTMTWAKINKAAMHHAATPHADRHPWWIELAEGTGGALKLTGAAERWLWRLPDLRTRAETAQDVVVESAPQGEKLPLGPR